MCQKLKTYNNGYVALIALVVIFLANFVGIFGFGETFFCKFANGEWLNVGKYLILILVGWFAEETYQRQNVKSYYLHEIKSALIYVIAFVISYIIYNLCFENFFYGGSLWKVVFVLGGTDQLLKSFGIMTYALVGDWTVPIIFIGYASIPLLNKLMKHKWTFILAVMVLALFYFTEAILEYLPMVSSESIPVGLFLILVGALLSRYSGWNDRKVWKWIVCVVIAAIIAIVKAPIPNTIMMSLLAIDLFVFLTMTFCGKSLKHLMESDSLAIYIFSLFISYEYVSAMLFCFEDTGKVVLVLIVLCVSEMFLAATYAFLHFKICEKITSSFLSKIEKKAVD